MLDSSVSEQTDVGVRVNVLMDRNLSGKEADAFKEVGRGARAFKICKYNWRQQ